MSRIRMSQSMIKDYTDYRNKSLCGLYFDARWISRTHSSEPSEAMMMGRWFEYLALGPYHGTAGSEYGMPSGDLPGGFKAAGRKAVAQWDELLSNPWANDPIKDEDVEAHWTAKYVNLWYQAKHLRSTFEAYGIEVIDVQKKIEKDHGKYDRVMVWDVLAICHKIPDPSYTRKPLILAGAKEDGDDLEISSRPYLEPHLAIIDVKATGLIDDKWKPYGWAQEGLEYRDKLMIQAVDYMDQVRDIKGEDYPSAFYFFVHSNTNSKDRKIYQIKPSQEALDQHREKVEYMVTDLEFEIQTGFIPYPSLERCQECPLLTTCEKAVYHPQIRTVYLTGSGS